MNRGVVALMVAAAVLAAGLWWLPTQRPFHGVPRAQLTVVPEDPAGLEKNEILACLGGAEEMARQWTAMIELRERYARAAEREFPPGAGATLSEEIGLAGWAIGPSREGGGRLHLLLRAATKPTRDANVFVHCIPPPGSLDRLPEFWRPHGLIALGALPPTPLSGLASGALTVVSTDLPKVDGQLTLRIGLMDERAVQIGTALSLGSFSLAGPYPPETTVGRPYIAVVRAAGSAGVREWLEVPVSVGQASDVSLGKGSDDTAGWEALEIGCPPGERPARIGAHVSEGATRTWISGRIEPGQTVRLERAGSDFARPVARWRLVTIGLGILVAGLAFVAVWPGRWGRPARAVALFCLLLVLARVALAESVETGTQWNVILAADVLSALIGCGLLLGAAGLIGTLRRSEPARRRAPLTAGLWVALATPLTLWFIGEWPGHLQSDQAQLVNVVSQRLTDPWLSTLYSVYASAVTRVFGNITFVTAINILLISGVLAALLAFLASRGVRLWVVWLFALLLMCSVPLGFLAIHLSHDVLTGFLKIAMVGVLLPALVRGREAGRPGCDGRTVAVLSVLTLAVSLLRGENLALLLYVPLILLVMRQARVAHVAAMAVFLLAGTGLYRVAIEPALIEPGVREWGYKERYQVSLLINPLGFMVHHKYFTPTPEEDKAAISEVIGWDKLVNSYTPFEIPYFWKDVKGRTTPEQVARLRRVYLRAAVNNPALFVGSRVITFAGCLGGRSPWYPFFSHREGADDERLYAHLAGPVRESGLLFDRDSPGMLSRTTHALREWASPLRGPRSPGYYLWNAWPALVLLVVALVSAPRLPLTAAVAGVVAAPLVLLLLAAPASHFKYVTDLYIFGFLVVPLALFERHVRPRLIPGPKTP